MGLEVGYIEIAAFNRLITITVEVGVFLLVSFNMYRHYTRIISAILQQNWYNRQ